MNIPLRLLLLFHFFFLFKLFRNALSAEIEVNRVHRFLCNALRSTQKFISTSGQLK